MMVDRNGQYSIGIPHPQQRQEADAGSWSGQTKTTAGNSINSVLEQIKEGRPYSKMAKSWWYSQGCFSDGCFCTSGALRNLLRWSLGAKHWCIHGSKAGLSLAMVWQDYRWKLPWPGRFWEKFSKAQPLVFWARLRGKLAIRLKGKIYGTNPRLWLGQKGNPLTEVEYWISVTVCASRFMSKWERLRAQSREQWWPVWKYRQ